MFENRMVRKTTRTPVQGPDVFISLIFFRKVKRMLQNTAEGNMEGFFLSKQLPDGGKERGVGGVSQSPGLHLKGTLWLF